MFQNSALPTATVELPQALRRTGSPASLGRLVHWIPLPRTAREYAIWTAAMLLVTGLVALQIWLSLRITQARQALDALQTEYRLIEQENAELLWQISQFTSLERVQIEATRMGYVPALQHQYLWAPADATPATTASETPAASSLIGMTGPADVGVATEKDAPWHRQGWNLLRQWWYPHAEMLGTLPERWMVNRNNSEQ